MPSADARPYRLLVFTPTRLADMLEKGNAWYVRQYESYFDAVDVVYLVGRADGARENGNTRLISVGSGPTAVDLLLAPFRLYAIARRNPATVYLTADQVFSWWSGLLIRWLLRGKVVLMPVAIPEQLYADAGQSLSTLPIPVERLMLRLSFAAAHLVYTARAFGAYAQVFGDYPLSRHKLLVTEGTVEALPSRAFTDALARQPAKDRTRLGQPITLIYVGRLHPEKLVDHAIRAVHALRTLRPEMRVRLRLIGDGPDRPRLEALVSALGLERVVELAGFKDGADVAGEVAAADVFVSPLTGTSLRESALAGTPVVAYDRDWVRGFLRHEQHALLVAPGDTDGLARETLRVLEDARLRERLSSGARALAEGLWTPGSVRQALAELHAAVASRR